MDVSIQVSPLMRPPLVTRTSQSRWASNNACRSSVPRRPRASVASRRSRITSLVMGLPLARASRSGRPTVRSMMALP